MRASPRPHSSTPWPLNPSTGRASSPQTLYKPKFATEPNLVIQGFNHLLIDHGVLELDGLDKLGHASQGFLFGGFRPRDLPAKPCNEFLPARGGLNTDQ